MAAPDELLLLLLPDPVPVPAPADDSLLLLLLLLLLSPPPPSLHRFMLWSAADTRYTMRPGPGLVSSRRIGCGVVTETSPMSTVTTSMLSVSGRSVANWGRKEGERREGSKL